MSIFARRGARAVRKLTRFHPREEIEVLGHGTITKRAIFTDPTIFIGLFGRHIAHVGLAFLHELHGELVKVRENNRMQKMVPGPDLRLADSCFSPRFFSAQPSISQWISAMMESTYSVSSFSGLVSSIRTLQTPANSCAMPKVQADRLGVADVKIAIRLRRKAGMDIRVLSAAHIFCDDVANEIGRRGVVVGWFRHAVARP